MKILVAPALTIYTYYTVDSQLFFKKNTTFVSSADRKKIELHVRLFNVIVSIFHTFPLTSGVFCRLIFNITPGGVK